MKKKQYFVISFIIITLMFSTQMNFTSGRQYPDETRQRGTKNNFEKEMQKPLPRIDRWRKYKEAFLQIQANKVNLAATSSNVELVGVWPYGPCEASDLDTSRDIAVVGNGSAIQVLDTSTPSSPSLLGEVVLLGKPADIAISGDYAYVGLEGFENTLYVIDIYDPANPSIEGQTAFDGNCYSLEVSGIYAYIACGNDGLKIFNVSTPASPFEVSTYSADGNRVFDVSLWSSYALIINDYYDGMSWISQLRVINVSVPGSPSLAGTYQGAAGRFFTAVDSSPAGYAYVADVADIFPPDSKILIIDVFTNPANPSLAGDYTGSDRAFFDVVVSGNYAYVFDHWECELLIADVSNPGSTSLIGSTGKSCAIYPLDVSGNLVGNPNYSEFTLYDVTDPSNPSLAGAYDVSDEPSYEHSIVVSGDYAYVAMRDKGLIVFDISDPSSPADVGVCDTVYGEQIALSGNYVYLIGPRGEGFYVINVSSPSSPTQVGGYYDLTSYFYWDAEGIASRGDYLYISGTDKGAYSQAKLLIYDLSDPSSPTYKGSYTDSDESSCYGLDVSGNYAYLPTSDYSTGDQKAGLVIVNVTDPTNPSKEGGYLSADLDIWANDVAVRENYAYLSVLNDNFWIIDISTPSSPSEIYFGGPGSGEIRLSGNCAYIGKSGLYVWDVSDPYAPTEVAYYYNGLGSAVEVAGNFAFMGGSLYILENTLAPEVSLTSPSAWSSVSGAALLSADALHPAGVDRVEFYVDDILAGSDSSAPYSIAWDSYSVLNGPHTIRATAYNNDGYSSDTEVEVSVNNNRSLILTATSGGTTDPVPGSYVLENLSEVTLTAISSGGYVFSGWSGDVSPGHEGDNPLTIIMDGNKNIEANFVSLDSNKLTIVASTGGTTDPAPGDYYYSSGTPVEVDALADSGYRFSCWSGDVQAGHELDNPVTITMDENKFLTANFVQLGWTSTKRLSWNTSDSNNPNVAVDSNRYVHMVWEDDNPGNYEIYYRRSTDGGVTWAAAKRLTWNSGNSRNPAIVNDSNDNIHVVWDDDTPGRQEIYYRKSIDGGTSWTAVNRLTNLNGDSRVPSIAVDSSDNIHIVWYDTTPGNNEIYYARSADVGVSWTNPERMTWNPSSSSYPCVAADSGDSIHIVWQDDGPGNHEIYYARSTDGGTSWPLTKRLTWNSGTSMNPGIASDSGNNIQVVWTDISPGNYEVFYKKSTNGGLNWPLTKRLTWNSGISGSPRIAIDAGNNICVAWNDSSPGNHEIYFKRSTNGGGAWSTKRLSWNGGASTVPATATYLAGEIHIVWTDDSPGNSEIYYKKGIH